MYIDAYFRWRSMVQFLVHERPCRPDPERLQLLFPLTPAKWTERTHAFPNAAFVLLSFHSSIYHLHIYIYIVYYIYRLHGNMERRQCIPTEGTNVKANVLRRPVN